MYKLTEASIQHPATTAAELFCTHTKHNIHILPVKLNVKYRTTEVQSGQNNNYWATGNEKPKEFVTLSLCLKEKPLKRT